MAKKQLSTKPPNAGGKCAECAGPLVPCAYVKCPQRTLDSGQATQVARFIGRGLAAQKAVNQAVMKGVGPIQRSRLFAAELTELTHKWGIAINCPSGELFLLEGDDKDTAYTVDRRSVLQFNGRR